MTTSHMVVVLRNELGTQLSLAQKEFSACKIEFENLPNIEMEEWRKKLNRLKSIERKVERLQKAVHCLGALQLGDIEDKKL